MKPLIVKELKEFMHGYFALGSVIIFVIMTYLFLWVFPQSSYVSYGFTDPQIYFSYLSYLFLFVVPLITVGMFSREYSQGTLELLRMHGLSWRTIVIGKLIAVTVFIVVIILATMIHMYVLKTLSLGEASFSVQSIIWSYIGVLLIGIVYASVSILVSSIIDHGTLAIIVSVLICFILYAGIRYIGEVPQFSGGLAYTLKTLSLEYHVDRISKGIMELSSIVWILSIIGISGYSAIGILELKNF